MYTRTSYANACASLTSVNQVPTQKLSSICPVRQLTIKRLRFKGRIFHEPNLMHRLKRNPVASRDSSGKTISASSIMETNTLGLLNVLSKEVITASQVQAQEEWLVLFLCLPSTQLPCHGDS